MDSHSLRGEGFWPWRAFSLTSRTELMEAVTLDPGVYVVRTKSTVPRTRGESDIFYIGSAANARGFRGRLGQYFSPGPTQSTNQRLLALISASDDYEIGFKVTTTPAEAKIEEIKLRERFHEDHGDLPPGNKVR